MAQVRMQQLVSDGLEVGNRPNRSKSILPNFDVKDSSERIGPTARRILWILPE
jgi:hypothetical protein